VIVPEALRNGYWRGEVRLQTGQGTEIPVWQTMVAHRDRGGELKLLTSILRDLRDQKAVESRLRESEAALRVLNAQLAQRATACTAVANDLILPITSIDAAARRVLGEYAEQLPPGARTVLEELSGAAAQMRTLIDALLLQAR
jgi:PAS domain-containing protein